MNSNIAPLSQHSEASIAAVSLQQLPCFGPNPTRSLLPVTQILDLAPLCISPRLLDMFSSDYINFGRSNTYSAQDKLHLLLRVKDNFVSKGEHEQ